MFDRILFPTDGSDGASAAFDHVLDIAADHGATVHVLNVADTTHDSVTRIDGEIVDVLEREGEEIVEAVADRAADRGIETVTKVLQGGVAETIAPRTPGSTRDGPRRHADSRSNGIRPPAPREHHRARRPRIDGAGCSSIRPDGETARYPYRNVLVPTDGSERAADALDRALTLAKRADATVHVLTVVDVATVGGEGYSGVDALVEGAEETVMEAAATAEEAGVDSVEAVEVGRLQRAGSSRTSTRTTLIWSSWGRRDEPESSGTSSGASPSAPSARLRTGVDGFRPGRRGG